MPVLKTDNGGYPLEYLLARIKVRRAELITDWAPLLAAADPLAAMPPGRLGGRPGDRSPEGMWRALLREFNWVYCQMDEAVKYAFFPFFLHIELRTVVLCLRNKLADNSAKIGELLACSLLAGNVKNVLAGAQDVFAAVAGVETAFLSLSTAFYGLKETYREKGLQKLERMLTDSFLEYVAGEKLNAVISDFIGYLIDFRNLMTLYKHSRWELAGTPVFLKGGSIGRARFGEMLAAREPEGMWTLLRRLPGMEGDVGGSGSPEHPLLLGLTRFLRLRSREPSGFGLVLEYLWRSYIETLNMGILCQSVSGDREAVAAELVR